MLSRQHSRPGQPWHGTFLVFAHDPEPGDDARTMLHVEVVR